jgi:hypothetical protein
VKSDGERRPTNAGAAATRSETIYVSVEADQTINIRRWKRLHAVMTLVNLSFRYQKSRVYAFSH